VDKTLDHWFTREILPHERALVRFLRRAWPNASDIADLRHDIYIRVIQSAAVSRPTHPKSFLFTTARNLLVDRARRNRIVSIELLEDLESVIVSIDELSPERQLNARQQLQRLSAIFQRLPERCREVLWLRKVESASQKEIAARLNMAEATVEAHLVRGVKQLFELFHEGDGVEPEPRERSPGRERKDGR
jgi:RNA polymerase sigma factor (sigma-70 family)